MKPEQAAMLRAPFDPGQIGKLPKPTKKENPRGHCNECGGYHGLPAVHLDYVGHAAVTDRLLAVDPEWTWEPAAVGPNGEPLTVDGGLWIKLTVAGVTRYGFGDAQMGRGPKEMIGDAIRNAAMRFGVGLDLWAKEGLHTEETTVEKPAPSSQNDAEEEWKKRNKKMRYLIGKLDKEQPREDGKNWTAVAKDISVTRFNKESTKDLTPEEHQKLIDELEAYTVPFG